MPQMFEVKPYDVYKEYKKCHLLNLRHNSPENVLCLHFLFKIQNKACIIG